MSIERRKALQATVVYELFVRTADENYITARWCVINGLYTDFFWLAVHALEKYLKAVLLMNGKSSIRDSTLGKKGASYSHNIVKLYDAVAAFAADLLPSTVSVPQVLIRPARDLPARRFLDYLYRRGNADNRYLLHGYTAHQPQDLFMLDRMVFAVRRLICPLDDRAFPGRIPCAITHRERLAKEPNYFCRLGMPLDDLIAASENSPTRIAALDQNVPFAPPDFTHTCLQMEASSIHHPIIDHRIFGPLQSNNRYSVAEGLAVAEWLIENVKLPERKGELRDQIKTAIEAAKNSRNPSGC